MKMEQVEINKKSSSVENVPSGDNSNQKKLKERYPEEVLRERYNVDALIRASENVGAKDVKETVLSALRKKAVSEDEERSASE